MVTEILRERLGDDVEIKEVTVERANGIAKHGINVMYPNSSLSPIIYIDEMEGTDEEKVEMVMRIVEESKKENMDLTFAMDYEKTKARIKLKLLNREKNVDYDACKFDTPFEDLIAIPYIDIGKAMIKIKDEMITAWNVDKEQVYKDALENIKLETKVDKIENFLRDFLGNDYEDSLNPMLVLTNTNCSYGAVNILCSNIEKGKLLLPSSIHEVILIDDIGDIDELKNIVRSVNDTVLEPSDFLSNNVYRSGGNGTWEIL